MLCRWGKGTPTCDSLGRLGCSFPRCEAVRGTEYYGRVRNSTLHLGAYRAGVHVPSRAHHCTRAPTAAPRCAIILMAHDACHLRPRSHVTHPLLLAQPASQTTSLPALSASASCHFFLSTPSIATPSPTPITTHCEFNSSLTYCYSASRTAPTIRRRPPSICIFAARSLRHRKPQFAMADAPATAPVGSSG